MRPKLHGFARTMCDDNSANGDKRHTFLKADKERLMMTDFCRKKNVGMKIPDAVLRSVGSLPTYYEALDNHTISFTTYAQC